MGTAGTNFGGGGDILTPVAGFSPSDGKYFSEGDGGYYTGYMKNVNQWCNALLEEARYDRNQDPEYRFLAKYMDYFIGNQWPAGRPTYKSRATVNRVWRLMWELVGLLTDIRPVMDVNSMNKAYDKQAEMLNSGIRSWWEQSNADLTFAMMILYGIFGTGFGRLLWDPKAMGGMGDCELTPLGFDSVMVFQAQHDIQTAEAVIQEEPRTLGWFKEHYPVRGPLVRPDSKLSSYAPPDGRTPVATGMMFDLLGPAMKRVMGNKQPESIRSTYPRAMHRQFWLQDYTYNSSNKPVQMGDQRTNWGYIVPPGKRLYPRKRLIVMGGDVVLYDGPSPYWHGKYPYVATRLNPVPWAFGGMSEIRPLVSPQDIINETVAGIVDMMKKSLNPLFYAPKNALSDAVWNSFDPSMPGARLAYSMNAGTKPEFAPQPQVPAYVLNMLGIIMREMDANSVGASVSDAANRKQVPAGSTLETIKQNKTTSVRLKGRNLEVTLRDLGHLGVSDILQYYSLKRRLLQWGDKGIFATDYDLDPGNVVPHEVSPQDHVSQFIFSIQNGTLLNLDKVEKAVELGRLRATGDLGRKQLLEGLELKYSAEDVEAEIEREIKNGTYPPMLAGAGKKPAA